MDSTLPGSAMMSRRRALRVFGGSLTAGSVFIGAACSSPAPKDEAAAPPESGSRPEKVAASTPQVPAPVAHKEGTTPIVLEVGDALKFSTREIKVAAGAKVELVLKHTGRLPKTAMGHNFVLLKQGTKLNTFANAALLAVKTDYIPMELKDSIIVHTKLIGGGESDKIVFDAPEAGTYTYVCTFPGHYAVMNGKLIVG